MPNLNLTSDQLANVITQTGVIQGAVYDPFSGVLSYPDAAAAAVNAAFANLAAGQTKRLKDYAASLRYIKETAGTAVDGHTYPTDRDSQPKFTAAAVMSQINTAASFNWKTADGSFVTLNATQMIAVASAVGAYVQRCFDKEQAVLTSIDNGTISLTSEIDAAFAVI